MQVYYSAFDSTGCGFKPPPPFCAVLFGKKVPSTSGSGGEAVSSLWPKSYKQNSKHIKIIAYPITTETVKVRKLPQWFQSFHLFHMRNQSSLQMASLVMILCNFEFTTGVCWSKSPTSECHIIRCLNQTSFIAVFSCNWFILPDGFMHNLMYCNHNNGMHNSKTSNYVLLQRLLALRMIKALDSVRNSFSLQFLCHLNWHHKNARFSSPT